MRPLVGYGSDVQTSSVLHKAALDVIITLGYRRFLLNRLAWTERERLTTTRSPWLVDLIGEQSRVLPSILYGNSFTLVREFHTDRSLEGEFRSCGDYQSNSEYVS